MKDGFAFPRLTPLGQQAPGMELRDWFAGMALQGLVSRFWHDDEEHLEFDNYAAAAFILADAMISQRNEEQNND